MTAFHPLADAPLADVGVDDFTYALAGGGYYHGVFDALAGAELLDGQYIQTLRERIAFGLTLSPKRERFVSLTDTAAYSEAIALGWKLLLTSGVDLVGAAAGALSKVTAIIDTLHAIGAVTNTLDARAVVATVLSVNAMLATGWHMSAIDTVAFQEAFTAQLTAVTALLDSAALTDAPAPSLRVLQVMVDTVGVADTPSPKLQVTEALAENVIFYTTLRLGDAEYSGWVMNQGAISEYRNYPFNGFLEFPPGSKKYYGTASDGLYLLEGDSDNGDDITAWIKTALMDFGTGQLKRVPDVYIAFTGSDKALLKVITTNRTGTQTEHWYSATLRAGDGLHSDVIDVGRGLKSRYWQMVLQNVDGADFALDELAFRVLVLDKRI